MTDSAGVSASEIGRRATSGPLYAEIRRLTEQNRRAPDPEIETRLVWLRHDAYHELTGQPRHPPAPMVADPFPHLVGLTPEIAAADLTVDVLRGAVLHHGCLLVRGLLPLDHCRRLADDVDHSLQAALTGQLGAPWWLPFDPPDSALERAARQWVVATGTVYAGDAPRMMFDLMEAFDAIGIESLVTELLGERPALTLEKCAVRRVDPGPPIGWHQDGRLLGVDIGTINIWAALSPCGRDASTLEIVPTRLSRILQTGTDPGFGWVVGQDVVAEVTRDVPAVNLEFEAGDALLFDEWLLHRTSRNESMTRPRYSIEAWFFTPSGYPHQKWVPLAF